MNYAQFKAAVESVGGHAVGVAAYIPPIVPLDEVDGYAVAVMFLTEPPICFVTQIGSAPRNDLEKMRCALAEALKRSRQQKPTHPLVRLRLAFDRLFK